MKDKIKKISKLIGYVSSLASWGSDCVASFPLWEKEGEQLKGGE